MVLVVSVVLGVGGREARERGRGRSGEEEARERERERGRGMGMADASGAVVSREELLSRQREEIRSHQQLAEGLGKVRPHKIECADGEEKEKSVLGAESVFLTVERSEQHVTNLLKSAMLLCGNLPFKY